MKRIALALIAVASISTAASAHDYSYGRERRIDAREASQTERIWRARQRGELTWLESLRLKNEQARIRRLEREARSDGYVSRYEARVIERAQDRASAHIYDQATDGQRAFWRRWY